MRKRITLLMLSAMLAGCASMADKLHGSLEPPAGSGYVIVSLTAWAFDPNNTNVGLAYEGIDNPVVHGSLNASLTTDTVFGEHEMTEGKLELMTLPPGRYRFVEAYGYTTDDTPFSIGPRIVRLPVNRSFDVHAGEAVYLGEVRLDLSYKPELILKTSQARDFAHIQRVWHVADTSRIAVHPLAPATQQQ